MNQFRNYDAPQAPQKPRVEFKRVLIDDDSADSLEGPEGNNEGFWPSTDPSAAGYVAPKNFAAAQAAAERRSDAWLAGEWRYVGVVARATIHVPIGQGSFTSYALQSPGLWGVESDAGEDYLADIFEEEKAALIAAIKQIGALACVL